MSFHEMKRVSIERSTPDADGSLRAPCRALIQRKVARPSLGPNTQQGSLNGLKSASGPEFSSDPNRNHQGIDDLAWISLGLYAAGTLFALFYPPHLSPHRHRLVPDLSNTVTLLVIPSFSQASRCFGIKALSFINSCIVPAFIFAL